jgi:Zn-dependent protease with chaperone function
VRLLREEAEQSFSIEAVRIPARLGNTPRRIALPDGSEFETADNDAVDALLDLHGPRRHGWLHRLESRLGAVVLATLLVLVAGAIFAVRGIPALSREAAFALSPEISAQLGQGAFEILDRSFEPTELTDERQAQLRGHFERLAAAAEPTGLTLVFRGGGPLRANAFALPDGRVILTDELVALAGDDEEIVAVMAHEVGHVVYRHGLRDAIQSSLLALAILLITGDLSSSFVAALPTVLAESRYSRDFEREADEYALAYMGRNDIDPERLAQLLRRLEQTAGGSSLEIPFLSSHPATQERIERLRGGR